MKRMLSLALLVTVATTAFAQSDKYVKAMEPKVAALDTTRNGAVLLDLANTFERIATSEKTQWLPYYYAALAQTNFGYSKLEGGMSGDPAVIDPVADKAETLLGEAEKLSANNSEIFIVRKMIASLRMLVDPQSRYMTYGPAAAQALETAKKLNPENPRVYLLEGQDKYFTPEQFGGSKEEAKKLYQKPHVVYLTLNVEHSVFPSLFLFICPPNFKSSSILFAFLENPANPFNPQIHAYRLLLITSCERSTPRLKNAPMNINRFDGGTTASLR